MQSFGKLYFDTLKYPPKYKYFPLAEIGWTTETEEPYRQGRCVVIKPPLSNKALIAGVFGKPQDEVEALSKAIKLRELDVSTEEIMEW